MHASSTDTAAHQRLTRTVVPANDPTGTGPTTPSRRSCGLAPTAPIRRAWPADAHAVAVLIAGALEPLALSAWLVPDPTRRQQVLGEVAAIHVEHALTEGQVWTTPDVAAALWLPYDVGQPNRPDDYERRLTEVCGPAVDRFRVLDQMSTGHHAVEPHHQHLAALAVRRDQQRHGLGRHLLTHQHTIFDAAGVPACATATDQASRALYRGLGYADFGPPIDLPDGPRLWPMWRAPRAASTPGHPDAPAGRTPTNNSRLIRRLPGSHDSNRTHLSEPEGTKS